MKALQIILSILATAVLAFAIYVIAKKSAGCGCNKGAQNNGNPAPGFTTAMSGSSVPVGPAQAVLTSSNAGMPRGALSTVAGASVQAGQLSTGSSDTYRIVPMPSGGDCCLGQVVGGKCLGQLGPCPGKTASSSI